MSAGNELNWNETSRLLLWLNIKFFFILNQLFIMFYHFKGMAAKQKKCERPGAKAVELFKKGRYEEAIKEFTKFLETVPDDENKKIALYNRGRAHNELGQHDSALEDGEKCLKIDPYWAKGYKCKGLALEGMGRPRDAIDLLLDAKKICSRHDPNTGAVLDELIKRLNKETGFLEEDLDLVDRKEKDKYCVTCNRFEKDMSASPEFDDGKKFISCAKCKMVNYCSRQHRKEDRLTHNEVCEELLMIKKNSEMDFDIQILPQEDALVLLVLEPKNPESLQLVNKIKRSDLSPDFKKIMDFLRGCGEENFLPLYKLAEFQLITKPQQKELNTWNDLFAMVDKWTNGLELLTNFKDKILRYGDTKRTLTHVLTDPMTVFYAMKKVDLLDNGDEDKIIRLHVVGAETHEEFLKINVLFDVLSKLTGRNLHIVYIGPLLIIPAQEPSVDPVITFFRGTYQDYILTSDYQKPDCIVAFHAGLYDGTYNWLPAVVQAVAENVPFLVTCNSKEDYQRTKEWLMKRALIAPEIVQDYFNPFCSWEAWQGRVGSNSVCKRNMFCLLFIGGNLDILQHFLRVEDEKQELVQFSCKLLWKNSWSDIMILKKSGKI